MLFRIPKGTLEGVRSDVEALGYLDSKDLRFRREEQEGYYGWQS